MSKAAREGERKQVTVLFADLKGASLSWRRRWRRLPSRQVVPEREVRVFGAQLARLDSYEYAFRNY
jgi:class 3 adenylate cyclase